MIKKIVKSLLAIYLIQFGIVACESDTCNCSTPQTLGRTYNDLELSALDITEIPGSEVSGSLDRASLLLNLSILFEIEQISFGSKESRGTNLGFARAYACSCIEDQFMSVDPITSFTINVTDTQGQNTTDVTQNFVIDGQEVSIVDYINSYENNSFWPDKFQFKINDSENIPDSSVFTFQIILESGTELTAQTTEINFE